MIYNRNESEVAILGDVQKYKVGIDEKNINHIVTILSSNLYSHPMTSFLRETVSNAVDSHIEAGSKEPIIIQRTATDLSIRDYGTGISPERFEEIYLNIGSSTKRQSDDYIGNFGIGRFSCLSVSDLANITSYYEGKAYYYVMNKDIDQLHIDLLYQKETTEPNGVEVKIPLKSWDTDTLDCLYFIDNVFVNSCIETDGWDIQRFNERKILNYKTFKVIDVGKRSLSGNTEILLGIIPYKVDYDSLWDYGDDWHRSWKSCFKYVFPKVEIGKVDITPNREELLYSDRTKKVLRETYDACIAELQEIWNSKIHVEYSNISEYILETLKYHHNTLMFGTACIPVSEKLEWNISYKGYSNWSKIPYPNRHSIISSIANHEVSFLGRIDDTLHQGKREGYWFDIKKLLERWIDQENTQILALPSKVGFSSQYFKDFVASEYKKDNILMIKQLPRITKANVKQFLIETFGMQGLTQPKERDFTFKLIKELLLYFKSRVIVTDVMKNPKYEQYKKDRMVKKKRNTYHTENICFTIHYCERSTCYKKTTSLDRIVPYIKDDYTAKCRIAYADLDSPFIEVFKGMKYPNLVILCAARNNMKYLQEGLPEWVRPVEELYSADNRVLQKYATIRHIINQPRIDIDKHGCFPKYINKMIGKLKEYKDNYSPSCRRSEIDSLLNIVPPEKYDRRIMALYNQTLKYLKLGYLIWNNLELRGNGTFGYYFLMKAKKLRLDYDFYRCIIERINNILTLDIYENNQM